MAHHPSRWALLASVALHFAALVAPFIRRGATDRQEARVDFWSGTTFEPSEVAEPGASDLAVAGGAPGPEAIDVEADWSQPSPAAAPSPEAFGDTSTAPLAPRHVTNAARVTRSRTGASAPARGGASAPPAGDRPGGGTFGAEGAPLGARDLLRSFVRALPTVASSDDVWSSLPLGHAGTTDVTLDVDGASKPRLADGSLMSAPAHLRRLIQKTMVVLSSGRFAPTETATHAARVRVAVNLTQLRAPSDAERAAGGVFGLGFEAADAHQVSRAYFTLASGRHVEVTVKKLSP